VCRHHSATAALSLRRKMDSVLIIADCESTLMVVAPGSTGQGAREAAFRRAREAFRCGIYAPLKEM
jgi:hypothetical protein